MPFILAITSMPTPTPASFSTNDDDYTTVVKSVSLKSEKKSKEYAVKVASG